MNESVITYHSPKQTQSVTTPKNLKTNIPKIDIAIVGNQLSGKTTLIKFWLSLSPDTIIVSDTYNKIIWIDGEAVQVSVKEISNDQKRSWVTFRNDKKYNTVVYVRNTDNTNVNESSESEPDLDFWIEYMKDKLIPCAYQVVLDTTLQELTETNKNK